jgi:hypothetical protein
MALRLLDRVRRAVRRRPAGGRRRPTRGDAAVPLAGSGGITGHAPGSHRRSAPGQAPCPARPPWPDAPPGPGTQPGTRSQPGGPSPRSGQAGPASPGRPATQPRPGTPARPAGQPSPGAPARPGTPPARGDQAAAARTAPRRWGAARAAIRPEPGTDARRAAPEGRAVPAAQQRRAARAAAPQNPWYETAHANRTAAGLRHCGRLEEILVRDWAPETVPSPQVARAVDRLAELPRLIKDRLVAGLDAIYVGEGGVPDLDDMSRLAGVPLPSGRATWDACAGAYGERKIIVGSRPSPSPDVTCHEIGHALDDIDGDGEQWQSDSPDFLALYEYCAPHMVSDFHRQQGILGRREFFADAFAAIASRQRPALVDMLGGDTRAALNVMLYFNVRYGI